MSSYKLLHNDNKNNFAYGGNTHNFKKEVDTPKICITCDLTCKMSCMNNCGTWTCPRGHQTYFDDVGNRHNGHCETCGTDEND